MSVWCWWIMFFLQIKGCIIRICNFIWLYLNETYGHTPFPFLKNQEIILKKKIDHEKEEIEQFVCFLKRTPNEKANENMDKIFYNGYHYVNLVVQADPFCSEKFVKKWARRILQTTIQIDSTEQIPIFMYYYPPKCAFAYCCDRTLSYSMLNRVAMRYVKFFLCKDLFIDTYLLKSHINNTNATTTTNTTANEIVFRSPLIDILAEGHYLWNIEENKKNVEKKKQDMGSDVFNRIERLNGGGGGHKKKEKKEEVFKKPDEMRNNFIRVHHVSINKLNYFDD